VTKEGSLEHRNLQSVVAEMKRLRADYDTRLQVLENRMAMKDNEILQLQNLFATQMVDRGSGPTTV
jgi:hypothetical protein